MIPMCLLSNLKMNSEVYKFFIVILLSFSCFSCVRSLGFGVVIWADENDELKIGEIVKVYAESKASKMYIVSAEDKNEQIEIPMKKLLISPSHREVLELKEKLSDLLFMCAVSKVDGLPLRAEPDNQEKQLYRLKKGQMLKLLFEEYGAPVTTGEKKLQGKWYKVMTDDGVQGYCFSYNLDIFDIRIGQKETRISTVGIIANEREEEEYKKEEITNELNAVLENTWYPEYYRKMINNKMVDLQRFSHSYGFFPGFDTKTARIILPTIQRTFQYSDIRKVKDKYRFGDSPVSLYIRNVDVITVEFTDEEGTRIYENFVSLNASVEKIIENEKIRRIEELKLLSGIYESQNYGNLEIDQDGFFYWKGYNTIVPFIIPENADNGGDVSLKYFLSREIKKESQYTGVISFKFSTLEDSIDFMYEIKKDGIVLEPVLKECIENGIVISRSERLILFFSKETQNDNNS